MICEKCGTDHEDSTTLCKSCGAELTRSPATPDSPAAMAVCKSCGYPVKPGMTFCGKCLGAKLDTIKGGPKVSRNDRIVAARISNKERQLRQVSLVGPAVTLIVGIFSCLAVIKTIFGAFLGIPLIIFATWWASELIQEKNKIRAEIVEFQKDFD